MRFIRRDIHNVVKKKVICIPICKIKYRDLAEDEDTVKKHRNNLASGSWALIAKVLIKEDILVM